MLKGYKRAVIISIFIHIVPLLILSLLSRDKEGSSNEKQKIRLKIVEKKSETKPSPVKTKGQIQTRPVSSPKLTAIKECKDWYGGIGMLVDVDNIVTKIYAGYPAETCLKVGDFLLVSIDEVKGKPGTETVVKYHRKSDILYCTLKRVKVCTDNFKVDEEVK